MSIQELGTIAQYRLGIRLLIMARNGTSTRQESFMEIDFEFYEKWNA
jgi:hypothetical protein